MTALSVLYIVFLYTLNNKPNNYKKKKRRSPSQFRETIGFQVADLFSEIHRLQDKKSIYKEQFLYSFINLDIFIK